MNMTAEHLAEYARMCGDCPEIQEEWEPEVGDWTDKGVVTTFVDNDWLITHAYGQVAKSTVIHLPRIDQLIRALPEDGIWKWQALYPADGKWLASAGYGTHGFTGVAPFPEAAALQAVVFAKTGEQWKDGRWK